jgi:hypothetical protein
MGKATEAYQRLLQVLVEVQQSQRLLHGMQAHAESAASAASSCGMCHLSWLRFR